MNRREIILEKTLQELPISKNIRKYVKKNILKTDKMKNNNNLTLSEN